MILKGVNPFNGIGIIRRFLMVIGFGVISLQDRAQFVQVPDSSQYLTLDQCIDYAFRHQPALAQANLNISITKISNSIALSGWLPQVNLGGNLTHYNELPTALVPDSAHPGNTIKEQTGVVNTTVPVLSVTQAIFSPGLLFAAKSAHLYVEQAEQITDSTKIDLVSAVSKAFYNLLLTLEQINVLKEDTARLSKNLSDAYHQYVGGIVDMTDYQEAAITLNNSKAELKQATENVVPLYATLKQYMGYPPTGQFNVSFDTTEMKRDIGFDTTQELVFEKRIEFRLLQTSQNIQHQITNYYHFAFLPSLSAFFNYNYEFEKNSYAGLYSDAYPYSYLGLSFSIPIFTGFSRLDNVWKARMQEQLLDWSQVSLKSEIYTEYTTALANYKGNLYNLYELQDNVAMAKNVYEIVTLQYQQGIVAYLNVITAESNLITSEIGYLNALFTVLSNKVDLEKAMGIITYNH